MAKNSGMPVYLTKNGYGAMVAISLAQYTELTGNIECKLDEANRMAELTDERLTHEDVFAKHRK